MCRPTGSPGDAGRPGTERVGANAQAARALGTELHCTALPSGALPTPGPVMPPTTQPHPCALRSLRLHDRPPQSVPHLTGRPSSLNILLMGSSSCRIMDGSNQGGMRPAACRSAATARMLSHTAGAGGTGSGAGAGGRGSARAQGNLKHSRSRRMTGTATYRHAGGVHAVLYRTALNRIGQVHKRTSTTAR